MCGALKIVIFKIISNEPGFTHKNKQCSIQIAEKLYVKAGHPKDAIDMYTKANMYEAAHKVQYLTSTEHLFCSQYDVVMWTEQKSGNLACDSIRPITFLYY